MTAKKQTQWSRAFNEKAYDRLAITVPKGIKKTIEEYAGSKGISVNGLVNRLLQIELGMTEFEWRSSDFMMKKKEAWIEKQLEKFYEWENERKQDWIETRLERDCDCSSDEEREEYEQRLLEEWDSGTEERKEEYIKELSEEWENQEGEEN